MSRPKTIMVLPIKEIGDFYNTAHFLRPVSPQLVQEYAMLMETGNEFPAITLGKYPGMKGEEEKLIVDGVHTYRAAILAKQPKFNCHVLTFANLAEALAEQLKRNVSHGRQVTSQQRDARIRQLIEVYNWTVRQVATAVNLHYASVSRINRKIQNVSTTGKRGASTEKKKGAVVPHALPPKRFIQAVQSIQITLSKPEGRGLALMAIYDPKRPPGEVQALVTALREVADGLAQLVNERAASKQTATG